MRVEDLRYFEHLAEVLNYTRASKDLDISQPTLSLAIKRLEEEWGVQLFSRNRSTVELTDIGRDISDCVTGALRSLGRRIAGHGKRRHKPGHHPCHAGQILVAGLVRIP